jgi:hypothetical protein
MFDPRIGRWLSEDPLLFEAGDANPYRYVDNDPTNMTDPSGRLGIFFDGTEENGVTGRRTTIFKIYTEYKKRAAAEYYTFKILGGPPFGPTFGQIAPFSLANLYNFAQAAGQTNEQLTTVGAILPGVSMAMTGYNAVFGARDEFDQQVVSAFLYVKKNLKPGKKVDIFGYSRGAIAAISLARILAAEDPPIPVRFMGLIDPSATYSGHDVPTIPSNVQEADIVYADGKATTGLTKVIAEHLMVTPYHSLRG